jgi:hypothetical protein
VKALVLVLVLAPALLGGCIRGAAEGGAPPREVTVVAFAAPAPPAPAIAPPAAPVASNAPAPVATDPDEWLDAVLRCEGHEACARAASRVPADRPHIAANARARANGAGLGCLAEATMAAALDDADAECRAAAKFAASAADRRLILATPAKAAAAWRAIERRLRDDGSG